MSTDTPPTSRQVTMLFKPSKAPADSPPLRVFLTHHPTDAPLDQHLLLLAHALFTLVDTFMADQLPTVLHTLGRGVAEIVQCLDEHCSNTPSDKNILVRSLVRISNKFEKVRELKQRWLQLPEEEMERLPPCEHPTIVEAIHERGFMYASTPESIGGDMIRIYNLVLDFVEMEFRVPEFRSTTMECGRNMEGVPDVEVSDVARIALEDIYDRIVQVFGFMKLYPVRFL
ncbi:uncharacterized protein LAJ45_03723 [Morchella importuna]|uniref:uncharacterized protein n=1 Tax=Morchella importuna TaxID=1174673 RepID=UPI001E8E6E57|nr:uncharacterized protein LAJ45_03723 [Morchella importuna]KAH8152296.1 hypothetical protein LAJ45_03723 [Morchella importuna]